MPIKVFTIPVRHADWAERELNQFVQSHRVLAVDRQWVDQGANSFWAVWVEYVASTGPAPTDAAPLVGKKKIDYKEILSKENFDVYLALRDLRKTLAAEDGVALYAVFTNDHLAQMVERRVKNKADLEQIAGIGEARMEKYGPRVLDFLNNLRKVTDETGGEPAGTDR